MDYSFLSLFYLLGAFLLGMVIMERVVLYRLKKALEEVGVSFDDSESQTSEINRFFIESSNDLLYLYEFVTHKFICQGKLLAELAELSNKYNNAEIACVTNYDEEIIWFINGKVKKDPNEG